MSQEPKYRLPARRRTKGNLSEKKDRMKARGNKSLDGVCLPELKNKQTFRIYQDQLQQIVDNEQQIKTMHRDLFQSQGFNHMLGRQVHESIQSNKQIREIINYHHTQSGYLMDEAREQVKVLKPHFGKHQNLFSIVYPRDTSRRERNEAMDESRLKELKTFELLKQLYMVHVQYINKMIRNMPFLNSDEEVIGLFKDLQTQFRLNSQSSADPKLQIQELNKLIRNLAKLKKSLQKTMKDFQQQARDRSEKKRKEEEQKRLDILRREQLKKDKEIAEQKAREEAEAARLAKEKEEAEARKKKEIFLTEQEAESAERERLRKEELLLEEQRRREAEEEEKRRLAEIEREQQERLAEEKRLRKEEKARLKEEARLAKLARQQEEEEERLREAERKAELKRLRDEEEQERNRQLQKDQRIKALELMEQNQRLEVEKEKEKERARILEKQQKEQEKEQRRKQRDQERKNREALKEAQEKQRRLEAMAEEEREKLRREEEERLRLIREAEELAQWKIDNYIYEYDKDKYTTTYEYVKEAIEEKLVLRNFQETIEILAEVQIYRKIQFAKRTVEGVIQRADEEFQEIEVDSKREIEKLKKLQQKFDEINIKAIKDAKVSEQVKQRRKQKETQLQIYLRFFNEINEYRLIYQDGEDGYAPAQVTETQLELSNIDVNELNRRKRHFIEERLKILRFFRGGDKGLVITQREMNSRPQSREDPIEVQAKRFKENMKLKREMKSYFCENTEALEGILEAVQQKKRPTYFV